MVDAKITVKSNNVSAVCERQPGLGTVGTQVVDWRIGVDPYSGLPVSRLLINANRRQDEPDRPKDRLTSDMSVDAGGGLER
jgi:hypothetical protein